MIQRDHPRLYPSRLDCEVEEFYNSPNGRHELPCWSSSRVLQCTERLASRVRPNERILRLLGPKRLDDKEPAQGPLGEVALALLFQRNRSDMCVFPLDYTTGVSFNPSRCLSRLSYFSGTTRKEELVKRISFSLARASGKPRLTTKSSSQVLPG
jgi:hypothetical protein